MINKSPLQVLVPPLIAIWKFLLVGEGSMGMLPLNRAERFRNFDARCFVYLRTFEVRQKAFFKNCVPFFFLLFDCPMVNSGPFSREKPHSLILITAFWYIFTQRSPGTLWCGWIPENRWVLCGTWTGNLSRGFHHRMIATQKFLSTMFCALQKDVRWMYDTLYECAPHFFIPTIKNFEKPTHFLIKIQQYVVTTMMVLSANKRLTSLDLHPLFKSVFLHNNVPNKKPDSSLH